MGFYGDGEIHKCPKFDPVLDEDSVVGFACPKCGVTLSGRMQMGRFLKSSGMQERIRNKADLAVLWIESKVYIGVYAAVDTLKGGKVNPLRFNVKWNRATKFLNPVRFRQKRYGALVWQ